MSTRLFLQNLILKESFDKILCYSVIQCANDPKFFYKQIGKKHQWTDRLIWQDKNWMDYISNKNLKTFILQKNNEYIGYFELIFHKNDCEIAYFGILEEYFGKKCGGYLLSEAIKKSNRANQSA